jgi:hypothetical protein
VPLFQGGARGGKSRRQTASQQVEASREDGLMAQRAA